MWAIFFEGPIARDIRTTVKIINVLFATFSYTYKLLLSLHSRSSDVDNFRSVIPTFQYTPDRSLPPVLSANSLSWSKRKCCSPGHRFIRGKRWTRSSVGTRFLPWSPASWKSVLIRPASKFLHHCLTYCHSWKFHRAHYSVADEFRLHCTPLHKEIEFTFCGTLHCFRYVYVLTMRSELTSAM